MDLLSIDERIARLEQMIENLSNFVYKLPSQLPTKTPGERRSITMKHKIKYVPVDLTNTEPPIPYPRFYTIKLPAEQKRSINPYRLNELIQDGTGCVAKSITTSGRENLNIEVTDDQQGLWLKITCSIDDIPCQINETTHLNRSRGIIYINEFNVENMEEFSAGLGENCNESKVEATFIKPRTEQTSAFLLEFKQETSSNYIYIPRERSDTKVYPYTDEPLHCANYPMYGHSKNRWKNITCGKCGGEGHTADNFLESATKYLHCGGPHRVKDKTCPVQVKEQAILDIQNKHKVDKRRARDRSMKVMMH